MNQLVQYRREFHYFPDIGWREFRTSARIAEILTEMGYDVVMGPELIDEKFGDLVDLVIDGGIGGIEPSTVVKCTDDELEIIRQGKGWLEEV